MHNIFSILYKNVVLQVWRFLVAQNNPLFIYNFIYYTAGNGETVNKQRIVCDRISRLACKHIHAVNVNFNTNSTHAKHDGQVLEN